jgi:hypothetical protein
MNNLLPQGGRSSGSPPWGGITNFILTQVVVMETYIKDVSLQRSARHKISKWSTDSGLEYELLSWTLFYSTVAWLKAEICEILLRFGLQSRWGNLVATLVICLVELIGWRLLTKGSSRVPVVEWGCQGQHADNETSNVFPSLALVFFFFSCFLCIWIVTGAHVSL